jgi:hypothetical protein
LESRFGSASWPDIHVFLHWNGLRLVTHTTKTGHMRHDHRCCFQFLRLSARMPLSGFASCFLFLLSIFVLNKLEQLQCLDRPYLLTNSWTFI